MSKIKTKGYSDTTILKAIKGSGGIITTIAGKLDCAWNTAEKYINKNETTRKAYRDEKEQILDLCESVVYNSVRGGNTQDAKWLLSTLGKKRGYGDSEPVAEIDNKIKIVITEKAKK